MTQSVMKRTFTLLLALLLLLGALPLSLVTAMAAATQTYTLENKAIKVVVSAKNGGFSILTTDGDKLNKDDSNKKLLFHRDDYDTSFTSFEVTDGSGAKTQYLFGGDYGYAGPATPVQTVQDESGITCTWSVDGYTFIQRIELANSGSEQHGTVLISYSVMNGKSAPVSFKARVLLDTALGEKDCAQYEVLDAAGALRPINKECVLDATKASPDFIPDNFFAYDDPAQPGITAYSMATRFKPYRLAFAHWNNLAKTLFDFNDPDNTLTFTNANNASYLTADSAMALYFDMGSVEAGQEGAFSTYYGVYSNESVTLEEHMAVNTSSPMSLELNAAKTNYISPIDNRENGKFIIKTNVQNYVQAGAKDFERVAIAVYPGKGITPLGSGGEPLPYATSRTEPYIVYVDNFSVGRTQLTDFYFQAAVQESACYSKVEIKVFNMPEAAQGKLVADNELGSKSVYILLPGTDGNVPAISFTGAEPDVVYYKGNRHLTITGENFTLLRDKGNYTVRLKPEGMAGHTYEIDPANVTVDETDNILDLYLTEEIAPRGYKLEIDWQDTAVPQGIEDPLTAPALNIVVSSEEVYKTESYGILAIVQYGTEVNSYYRVETLQNETQLSDMLSKGKNSRDEEITELIMTLRGQFTVEETQTVGAEKIPTKFVAVSTKSTTSDKPTVTNPVTINNCLDFEDGNIAITVKNLNDAGGKQEILIDLDGALYTSVERTSVSKGIACFSSIKNGTDHGLVKYNKDGARITPFPDYTISLSWTGVGGVAQSIGGMLFNLTYCKLGVMYDTKATSLSTAQLREIDVMGYVASYYANLDLGFLIPSNKKKDALEPTGWKAIKEKLNIYDTDTNVLRYMQATRPYDPVYDEDNPKETGGQASVMVDDILFGLGKGFVGFHLKTTVKIPGYIDAMPNMTGKLEINTIGAWQFGFEGKCQFTTIELEARLKVKSHNDIPVPDSLYFYVAGFTPGIPVDPFGVVWITGGGGGFENLYDTIFVKSAIPPLRLLLSIQLNVLQVLEGRADMSLGLRGVSFVASNVKLKATEIVFVPRAQVQVDWYPQLYLVAGINMDIFDCIKGSGYIVADMKLNTYEVCVRAGVSVPGSIPVVGGIEVANVILGANTKKIWGTLTVLDDIHLGITYYWGDGGVDFGTGGNTTEPTYPALLSAGGVNVDTGERVGGLVRPVAVYYDEEADKTLYMVAGTNLRLLHNAAIEESGAIKLGAGMKRAGYDAAKPVLQSDKDRKKHELNLNSSTPCLLQVSYSAADLSAAKSIAGNISVKNITNASPITYQLTPYSETDKVHYNTNVTFDKATGTATAVIKFSGTDSVQKVYEITTPQAAALSLYGVTELPGITRMTAEKVNNKINVTLTGTKLKSLDDISFYLVQDTGVNDETGFNDNGEPIGRVAPGTCATIANSDGTVELTIPDTLASGDYYVRAVYSKEGSVNSFIYATDIANPSVQQHWTLTNSLTPSTPVNVTADPCGDLMMDVHVDTPSQIPDAYILTVYDDAGKPTDVSNVFYETNGSMPALRVGGSYTGSDGRLVKTMGLESGKRYKVGVIAVRYIKDASNNVTGTVQSEEAFSGLIDVTYRKPKDVRATADTASVTVTREILGDDGYGNRVRKEQTIEAFKTGTFNLMLAADEDLRGTFTLNGAYGYSKPDGTTVIGSDGAISLSTTPFTIPFTDLPDGDYQIEIVGKNDNGDSFRYNKTFTVDTMPPVLLISQPVNGGIFGADNNVTLVGVFDPEALFTINLDGTDIATGKTISQLGGTLQAGSDSVYELTLNLGAGKAKHDLLILASDKAGNAAQSQLTLQNAGLGQIAKHEIVYSTDGGATWNTLEKNNINTLTEKADVLLAVQATTKGERGYAMILNDPALVSWDVQTAQGGNIALDSDGYLRAPKGSTGAVFASLAVSAAASRVLACTVGAEAYAEPFPTEPASPSSGGTGVSGGGAVYERCSLLYDANGGEGIMVDVYSPYVKYTVATVMKNAYTREGYVFNGFNTKSDGTGLSYQSGDKFVLLSDTVLYAQWTKGAAAQAGAADKPSAGAKEAFAPSVDAVTEGNSTDTPQAGGLVIPAPAASGEALSANAYSAKAQIEALPAPERSAAWLPYVALAPFGGGLVYALLWLLRKRFFKV